MLFIFVLPRERILPLVRFPKNLEHDTLVHQIEAITNCLQGDPFATESHLVNESFRFPDIKDFVTPVRVADRTEWLTYCFISALSWPLTMTFFLELIFELKSSTVTSRPSSWNRQMNCFFELYRY